MAIKVASGGQVRQRILQGTHQPRSSARQKVTPGPWAFKVGMGKVREYWRAWGGRRTREAACGRVRGGRIEGHQRAVTGCRDGK